MIVLELQYQGRRRRIATDRDQITIGRGRNCEVQIDEPGIAERHCTIRREQVKRSGKRGAKTVLLLEDHQTSDEPTRVNGFETIKAQVAPGDVIEVGPATATVRDGATSASAPASPRTVTRPPSASDPRVVAAAVATPMDTAGEPSAPQPRPRTRSGPRVTDPDHAPEGFSRLMIGILAATLVASVLLVALTSSRTKITDKTGEVAEPTKRPVRSPFAPPVADRPGPRAGGPTTTQPTGTARDPRAEPGGASTANPTRNPGGTGPVAGAGDPKLAPRKTGEPSERLTKKQIYLRALNADRAAQQNDFAKAVSEYRTLLASTADERLLAEINDRVTDLDRLATAVGLTATRLAGAPADAPSVSIAGTASRVIGASEQGLRVEMPNGERGLPWAQVPMRSMERLLRWSHEGAEADLVAGRYLFEFKTKFESDSGLERSCHACFQRALEIAPGRKADVDGILRRALGVTSEKGFVLHEGLFMTAERRDRILAVRMAKAQMKNLESSRAAVRQQAYAYLRGVDDLEIYRTFRQALEARRLSLGAALVSSGVGKKLVALRAEKEKFLTKRKVLMDRIFDLKEYPYPYRVGQGASQEDYRRYLASQKIIDDRTRVLRKDWASGRGSFALAKPFLEQYEILREVEVELAKFPPDEVPPAPALTPLLALGDPAFLVEHYRGKMTVASLPMNAKERHRLEYTARVLAHNVQLECSATKTERQQVLVTNLYRHMLGRHALMLNPKLLESSRGHSRDMVLKGYFSHTAPDPERRTPAHRIRLAGYEPVSASENIARGSSGPEKVHDRWCHSSGHHRNLLGPKWYEMGSGNVGAYWTQNFASQGKDFYKLQAVKDGG